MSEPNLTIYQAREQLQQADQSHVLHYWDDLSETQRQQLLGQIASVDWPEVTRLIESHVKSKPQWSLPENVEPAPWYPNDPGDELAEKYRDARSLGETLIAGGKVAAFTVAGGQGTRLGFDGPKGAYPATPVRGLPLFGCFAEYLHNIHIRFGVQCPWYIMTSPINDAPTRAFFEQHQFFNLDPANVRFFPQAMMPAIDAESGKVLLADKHSLALSPNGHGGSLKALHTSGAIEDMQNRGIEQISYIQVDNPIVRVIDPLFIGLHAMDDAQMSSKMLPKREPLEKLGNFCLVDGKVTVIEYSNLPDKLAHQTTDAGELRFRAGSIAIHMIRVDFVESLNTQEGGFSLPWNRADKKVPYLDLETGERVEPTEPNAVKLETFVFDALPQCEASIVYETDRSDEFAPIKNADDPGCNDCPSSSKQIQSNRAARWLEAAGVEVPWRDGEPGEVDALIDLPQVKAIYEDDVKHIETPHRIEPGTHVTI
jgi:UDP-N-acetylglucosamine/UDP-N-acetylgalactosamine diphosphorylase